MLMAMITRVIGVSKGKVIFLNICQPEAPSILAASTTDRSIVSRPTKNSSMSTPMVCHVEAVIIE